MIYDMINRIFSMIPRALGYPWEGGVAPDQRPLRLLDALGRDLMIPAIFLSSRKAVLLYLHMAQALTSLQIFHDTLELVHRDLPGHRKILLEEYSIADEDAGGEVINTTLDAEWSKAVQAGKTVSINMIFQTLLHSEDAETCPRCKAPARGPTLEAKRRRWSVISK